ncbi:hypothetical protein LDENG_00251090, partial [Lucifuga dentata]
LTIIQDNSDQGRSAREQELENSQIAYRWHLYKEGLPYCMKVKDLSSLPPDARFSFTKKNQFKYTACKGLVAEKLELLTNCEDSWTDFEDINRLFWHRKSKMSKYTQEHWRDNDFFVYQFLNGVNPILIRHCSELPQNFPVTEDMISLQGQASLADEMKRGNIFLCDYKLLDGVQTNVINGKKQYLVAPLHKTPDDKLMPVAIQLKQKPAADNPIFLPTDSEYDWLTAKIFVRSADFNEHQLNVHLLRTHLLPEVFTVSLHRNLPMVHPLYKLLMPHTRYILQINSLARRLLISEDGVFTQYTASGGEGMITILRKAVSSLTYSSLCIPDDIAE